MARRTQQADRADTEEPVRDAESSSDSLDSLLAQVKLRLPVSMAVSPCDNLSCSAKGEVRARHVPSACTLTSASRSRNQPRKLKVTGGEEVNTEAFTFRPHRTS